MIISQLGLTHDALKGETAIVTGAGGGIGYEAARALLWLGATVVIAEIDQPKGEWAAQQLAQEFGPGRAVFVRTDVGDERSVKSLEREAVRRIGEVDIVINNATIAVLGNVKDVPIEQWDASYRVNLRGPVLMARAFLPGMLERNHGVFVCVSSTGTAFLGGYETFKTAQVHLANTIDAELEGTEVIAFTIGPGLVRTETAMKAVPLLASKMGMTVDEFFDLNKGAILSPEEAGTGFAVSIVFAKRFRGQEISSMQALKAANIQYGASDAGTQSVELSVESRTRARALCERVYQTLKEQSDGWKHRSLFERQWVIRDFKKNAGMPVEDWLDRLESLRKSLEGKGPISPPPLLQLSRYWTHQAELAKGYEKDPAKLDESLKYVYGWREEVEKLHKAIQAGSG
jgi:NAD(P)-dependent dehydrogenase (short-subunit alcohol dehydrogenase family)